MRKEFPDESARVYHHSAALAEAGQGRGTRKLFFLEECEPAAYD
jgi:hypothetical protein